LLAAHRQDRVRERQEETQDTDGAEKAEGLQVTEEAQRVLGHVDVPARHVSDLLDRLVLLGNGVALGVELGLEAIGTLRVADPDGFFLRRVPVRGGRLVRRYFLVFDLDVQVRQEGHVLGRSPPEQGNAAPGDNDHRPDRGGNHDLEGLIARLVKAQQVLAKEIQRDQYGQDYGAPADDDLADLPRVLLVQAQGLVGVRRGQVDELQDQAHDVLPGGNAARGAGQDVVEHQGRDRQLGQEAAHGFLDHAVDAATDEQRAALDIDRAHGIAKEHDGQDEPGRGRADGVLDDAADVVDRAGQVAEDDRGRAPVRDESEGHAADDEDRRRLA